MPRPAATGLGGPTGASGRFAGARWLAWDLAARGVAWILAEAAETTQGQRFRVWESDSGPAFPAGIYDGAAGVAIVLADWTRATRDLAARETLRSVAEGIAASASPRTEDVSLYFGTAGRIAALLRSAETLRAPALRDAALDLAPSLLRATWPLADLLYGPAGTGIVLLQLYRATGDRRWLRGARRALAGLDDMAVHGPEGIAWACRPPPAPAGADHGASDHSPGSLDTGLAHGVGGILLFLEQAAPLIAGRRLTALRAGARRWLAASAVPVGRGLAWPKAIGDDRYRHHWCHGTAGLVLSLAADHRTARTGAARTRLGQAGRHAWEAIEPAVRRGAGESACHCHGLAGTLDALAALDRLGGTWVRRPIAQLVDRLAQMAGPGPGPASFGLTDSGLETGVAGVVRALMLAAGMRAPAPYEVSAVSDLHRLRAPRLSGSRSRVAPRAPAAALPHVAALVEGDGRLVVRTTADHPRLARASARLLADDRLGPLHESWELLGEGLATLAAAHSAWVRPDALAAERHLAFMQRIAGLLLHGTPPPAEQRHRRSVVLFLVRRHLAAVARCLELVAHDRGGVLSHVVAGPLRRLQPLDGEPHRGGQRAIALRFAEGPGLAFKSRDLRVEAFIIGDAASTPLGGATILNRRLERELHVRIPTHGVWSAGPNHGYVEHLSVAGAPLGGGRTLRFADALGGALPALRGHTLASPREATAFWRAAGALASHLATFGVGDQHSGNLFLGRSRAEPSPRLHALDCEVAFAHAGDLGGTQLVPSRSGPNPEPAEGPHTHFGLETRRWDLCGYEVPPWALTVDHRGRLVLVYPPGQVQRRLTTPVVVSPDGSSGYAAHVGAVLRGAVEHWLALRATRGTLVERMRSALDGARVRVLRKSTTEYVLAMTRRELGSGLWTGALASPLVPEAQPFDAAELAQLAVLDVPAFDRALGQDEVTWVVRPPDGRVALDRPPASPVGADWWRMPGRAAGSDALARAVGELVGFVAPPGVFSWRDAANGAHTVRAGVGEPVQVALAMPRGVAQFRLDPDGGVTYWGLPSPRG